MIQCITKVFYFHSMVIEQVHIHCMFNIGFPCGVPMYDIIW